MKNHQARRQQYDGDHVFDVETNESIQQLDTLDNERILSTGVLPSNITGDGNDIPFSAIERITRYYCSDEAPPKMQQRQHMIEQSPKERKNRRQKDRGYRIRNAYSDHDTTDSCRRYNAPTSVSNRTPSVLTEGTFSLTSRRNDTATAASTQMSEPFLKGRKPAFGELSVVNNQVPSTRLAPDDFTSLESDEHKEREHHVRQLEIFDKMLTPNLEEMEQQNFSLTSGLSNSYSQLTSATMEGDWNRFRLQSKRNKEFDEGCESNLDIWQSGSRREISRGNKKGNFSRNEFVAKDFFLSDSNRSRNYFDDDNYQMVKRTSSEHVRSNTDHYWHHINKSGKSGDDKMNIGRRGPKTGTNKTHLMTNTRRMPSMTVGSVENHTFLSLSNSGTNQKRLLHYEQFTAFQNQYVDEDNMVGEQRSFYSEEEKFHHNDLSVMDDRSHLYHPYDVYDRKYIMPYSVVNDSLRKQIENRSSKLNSTLVSKESKEEAMAAVFNFFQMNEVDLEKILVAPAEKHGDRSRMRPPKRIQTTNEVDDGVSGVTTPTQLEIPNAVLSNKKVNGKTKKQSKGENVVIRSKITNFGIDYSLTGRNSNISQDHKRNSINVQDRDEMTSVSSIATSVDYYIGGGYSSTRIDIRRREQEEFHNSHETMIVEEDDAVLEEKFDKIKMEDRRSDDYAFEHPSWSQYDAHDSYIEHSFQEELTSPAIHRSAGTAARRSSAREVEDADSLFLTKELEQSLLRKLQIKKAKGNNINKGAGLKKEKKYSKERQALINQATTSSTTSPISLQKRLEKHYLSKKCNAKVRNGKTKKTGSKQFNVDLGDLDPNCEDSGSDDDVNQQQFLICCESASDFESYHDWNHTPPDALPFKSFRTSACSVVSELTRGPFGSDALIDDDDDPEESSEKDSHRSTQLTQPLPTPDSFNQSNVIPTFPKLKTKRSSKNKGLRWRDGGLVGKDDDNSNLQPTEVPLESVYEFPKQVDETCRIVIILLKSEKQFQEMLDRTVKSTDSNNDAASTTTYNAAGEFDYLHCDFKTQHRLKVRDILVQLPNLLQTQLEQRQRQQDKVEKYMTRLTGSTHVDSSPRRDYDNTCERYTSLYMLGSELINVLSLQDYFCAEADESQCLLRDGLIFFAVPSNYSSNDREVVSKRSETVNKKRFKQQLTYASIVLTKSIRNTLVAGRDLHHLKSSSELGLDNSDRSSLYANKGFEV